MTRKTSKSDQQSKTDQKPEFQLPPTIKTQNVPNTSQNSQNIPPQLPITRQSALIIFLTCNLFSAIFSYITDCDESFNYWEPLHHVLFPKQESFQTWEYASQYALRSWAYLGMHAQVLFIHAHYLKLGKSVLFQFLKCGMALICSISQTNAYASISTRFGGNIGKTFLFISAFSTGSFISSTAFLPSSFCMYCSYGILSCWLNSKMQSGAVFLVGMGAIMGWPFFGAMGVPVLLDIVFRQKKFVKLVVWTLQAGAIFGSVTFLADWYFYGRMTLSPLNIVIYNVFGDKGPDLYGVEPLSFYLKNLFLNWNIASICAYLSLPTVTLVEYIFSRRIGPTYRSAATIFTIYLSPLYLWLLIFFTQPHKEERFLFPVYPFIAFAAAVFVSSCQKIYKLVIEENFAKMPRNKIWNQLFLVVFCGLSVSRSVLLVLGYGGGMSVYSTSLFQVADRLEMVKMNGSDEDDETSEDLQVKPYNLCLGKEWHRFGTHFLVPEKFQVHLIESEFRAQLPAKFVGFWPASVQSRQNTFNDDNLQDMSRYLAIENCDFLIEKESKFEESSVLQPKYSESDDWEVVDGTVWRFLNAEKSKWWARVFYIPGVFEKFCEFDEVMLLMRKSN